MGLLSIGRGESYPNQGEYQEAKMGLGRRTFRQTVQDKIAYHQSQIDAAQAVLDSMSPEVERFVEAVQKTNF